MPTTRQPATETDVGVRARDYGDIVDCCSLQYIADLLASADVGRLCCSVNVDAADTVCPDGE